MLWGVETPTGRNGHFLTGGGFRSSGSGTGYAGFLIRGGTEFIDTGTRAHTRWVNMTTGVRNSTAKWALGWVPVGRYWARVWVLMRLTPDDHAVAPFVIVRRP